MYFGSAILMVTKKMRTSSHFQKDYFHIGSAILIAPKTNLG